MSPPSRSTGRRSRITSSNPIRRNKVALKGPITTPVGGGFRSVNVTLRQALDLYANLRPARSMKGLDTRYEDVDLIIVRENTEDLYAGIEHMVGTTPPRASRSSPARRPERIARYAFEYAVANGRPQGHGRPQGQHHEAVRRPLPRELPDDRGRVRRPDRVRGPHRRQHVHAARPEARSSTTCSSCRTCTATSSATCAPAWSAASGVAPGANIGTEAAVFEPVHGSAPKYAGPRQGEPDRDDPVRGADAPAPRSPGGGDAPRDGGPRDHRRGWPRPTTSAARPGQRLRRRGQSTASTTAPAAG